MKQKIAIGVFNSKFIHSSLAPWNLAAGLRENLPTAEPIVLESTINLPVQELLDSICAAEPSVIGLCCYIWNWQKTQELLPLLRARLPGIPLVLGGPEVAYCADEVLDCVPVVDYIVSGEGEVPFAKLCEILLSTKESAARRRAASQIPGICTRDNPDAEPYLPTGLWPSPYTEDYLLALQGRIAYLESSRGCPFSCAFCLSGRCSGVRFLPLQRTREEILLLAGSGAQTVKFVDRTFNCNRERALAIWRFIIEHYGCDIPQGVCFHFEIAGDLLDEECLQVLASAPAGSMQLEIGLQSFYAPTLEAVNRKTDMQLLEDNIKAVLLPNNLHIHIDLIAGLPLETPALFAESFEKAFALQPHMLQLGFLKLLHGSVLREQAVENGCRYSPEPPYEIIENRWMPAEQLARLHDIEDALERLYNSGRFLHTLRYVKSASGLDAYDMFDGFGMFMRGRDTGAMSLDQYVTYAYEYFSSLKNVRIEVLRDVMVCDRLATNSSGKLPSCLQRHDPAGLKAAAKRLPRQKPGCRRGLALLYEIEKVVWVDYEEENRSPVSEAYQLRFLPLAEKVVQITTPDKV